MSLCTTAYPFYTRFTNIIGTSTSKAKMQPKPRQGSPGSCLGQAPGGGPQVVQGFGAFELCDQGWTAKPKLPQAGATATGGADAGEGEAAATVTVSLEIKGGAGLCLSAAGEELRPSIDPVWARLGRLSALSVSHCKSVFYSVFVWGCRALNSQKRRFPARAVVHREQQQ